jgi:glutaredoxin
MNAHVIIYSQDGCPYCSELKEGLEGNNIKFIVRDIGKYEDEWKLVSSITDNEYVPTACVIDEKTHKSKFLAPDRDWQDISECVDKIKKLL